MPSSDNHVPLPTPYVSQEIFLIIHSHEKGSYAHLQEVQGEENAEPLMNQPAAADTASQQHHTGIQLEIPIAVHLEELVVPEKNNIDTTTTIGPRMSKRNKKKKQQKLSDYQCAMTSPHTIDSVVSYVHLSPVHKAFAVSISANDEPKTY